MNGLQFQRWAQVPALFFVMTTQLFLTSSAVEASSPKPASKPSAKQKKENPHPAVKVNIIKAAPEAVPAAPEKKITDQSKTSSEEENLSTHEENAVAAPKKGSFSTSTGVIWI